MPTVVVSDGTKLNYYLDDYTDPWAESETILVVHGAGENGKLSYRLARELVRKYKVIRPDERGCGESSMPRDRYEPSFERFAEDELNILDHLGIQKVHFFAYHSGGWMGIHFAVSHPERVKSLIISNIAYKESSHLFGQYTQGEKDLATAIMKYGFREYMKRGSPVRSDTAAKMNPKELEWFDNTRGENITVYQAARYQWAASVDCWELLGKIKVPTLIISGDDCNAVPLEMLRSMEQQIPNSRLVILENTGCSIQFASADRCAQAIDDFIQTID